MRPLLRFLSLCWPIAVLIWLWTRHPAPGDPLANGDLLPLLKFGGALFSAAYWISAVPDWWHGVAIPASTGRALHRALLALLAGGVLFAAWIALNRR